MRNRKFLQRLLAVTMAIAVVLLATSALTHQHANASDEVRCQACHIGHAAAPAPAAPVAIQAPVAVARFVPAREIPQSLTPFLTASTPRAPPA